MTIAYPEELIPRIIFEDAHLIVLSKPPGLLSQGEKTGDLNLVDWLRRYFGRNYVGLIHRLDRNTSGIMIVAKRTKSAQRLTDSLQKGNLQRWYKAWVLGRMEAPAEWSHSLWKDEAKNLVRALPPSDPRGKRAALRVRPIAQGQWRGRLLTLVEFELETGRSHQIRAQSAAEGFPLLGDTKYGEREPISPAFGRPALHSSRLRFEHPMSKEWMTFEEDLPEDMRNLIKTSRPSP